MMNAILASPLAAICGGLAGLAWVRGYLSENRRKRSVLWIIALALAVYGLLCPEPVRGDNHGDASQKFVIAWVEPEWGLIVKVMADGGKHPATYDTVEEAVSEAHRMADARNEPFMVFPIVLPRYK